MNERVARVNNYFDQKIEQCNQCIHTLQADDRRDEANLEKVRANVYDIFRTILSVAVKTGQGDPEAVKRFFVSKTEQIPSGWVTSYEQAEKHGDAVKMAIEQIKLDTVDEIRQVFVQIWEGEG